MYHREPLCTPLICRRLHVPSTVKGQVDHTISRRCAAEYAPAARILLLDFAAWKPPPRRAAHASARGRVVLRVQCAVCARHALRQRP